MKSFLIMGSVLLLFRLWAGTLEIRCTADLHGEIERVAQIAPLLLSDDPAVLRIDAGDTLQGTLHAAFSRGKSMIAALNTLRFDVWVPGNHDFEFGSSVLLERIAEFQGTVLGADWQCQSYRPVHWIMIEKKNLRCAVIGMTEPGMARRLLPGSGPEFFPAADALRAVMPEIRRAEPALIILVWHNGLFYSGGSLMRFLHEFPEIDLVIGGHSHEEHAGELVAHSYFVQPGKRAEAVGAVSVEFDDRSGNVIRIRSRLLRPVSSRQPSFLSSEEKNRYDAFARQLLPGGTTIDAFGDEVRKITGSEVALSMLSEAIPGNCTRETLFRLIAYENELCTVRLSRQELHGVIAELLVTCKRWNRVPVISGVKYTLDRRGRLKELIDAPAECSVALNSYLLTVGKILPPLLKEKPPRWKATGLFERDILENLFK